MNSRCRMKPSRPVSLRPDLAMTATLNGLSASDIVQAVAGRKISALAVTEAALARIARHNPVLNAFTDVTADRARECACHRCRCCGWAKCRPACRRAVRGQKPVRRAGAFDARRIEDQSRSQAGAA